MRERKERIEQPLEHLPELAKIISRLLKNSIYDAR
jgi:hypothetical protein